MICYFWFTGWTHISLGLHIDLSAPNIEIHIPFGFFRIGWLSKATKTVFYITDPPSEDPKPKSLELHSVGCAYYGTVGLGKCTCYQLPKL